MTSPLNDKMDDRRVELDMDWQELATAARMSISGLSAIRAGDRNPSRLTKRRLETALRWAAGSIDAILDGGDPEPLIEHPADIDLESVYEQNRLLRQALRDNDQQAAIRAAAEMERLLEGHERI